MMGADIKVLLLGLVTILLLALYSFSDFDLEWKGSELRKADFTSLYDIKAADSLQSDYSIDSLNPAYAVIRETAATYNPDTTQNILFIGDSMLEGLTRRFINYTDETGHELNTIIWYSSTTESWANTDTLNYFIKKFAPTYIVICLGSNELFIKDLSKRKENIAKIINRIGTIPFVWISPPNWKEDTGINEAILRAVGKDRYFDSRNLNLERGHDHAHPTFRAAGEWMDTIALWMSSDERMFPLRLNYPSQISTPRNITVLSPE